MVFGDERVPARIWAKITPQPDACWLWNGATGGGATHRYGIAVLDGVCQGVHRWMFGVADRPATPGEHVHHCCGRTLCVNPAHLQALPIVEHIGQWHRDKTHCPQGHAYDEANTHVRREGWRSCRTCARLRTRAQRAKAVVP